MTLVPNWLCTEQLCAVQSGPFSYMLLKIVLPSGNIQPKMALLANMVSENNTLQYTMLDLFLVTALYTCITFLHTSYEKSVHVGMCANTQCHNCTIAVRLPFTIISLYTCSPPPGFLPQPTQL